MIPIKPYNQGFEELDPSSPNQCLRLVRRPVTVDGVVCQQDFLEEVIPQYDDVPASAFDLDVAIQSGSPLGQCQPYLRSTAEEILESVNSLNDRLDSEVAAAPSVASVEPSNSSNNE